MNFLTVCPHPHSSVLLTFFLSSAAKRLIGRLMVYDRKYRETVYGALQSSWIISDLEDLEGAYKERIGPSEHLC